MTFVKAQSTKVKTKEALEEESTREKARYQIPALATLIYVDSDCSLPTGQWSAVSATV